uniref:Pyruvate dehydrogenase E1 component subunit alpha n=1 Tax=Compsopogon caeruleus TaxID=31354 RepID=A0A7S1TDD9_9RHOD|mmetsp:Transcript_1877/g.3406  ORF Transcript_1877/g.3406 Transcript_1877/m.3406 type:complete len:398 (+) Transcript_1877:28-1221(+)
MGVVRSGMMLGCRLVWRDGMIGRMNLCRQLSLSAASMDKDMTATFKVTEFRGVGMDIPSNEVTATKGQLLEYMRDMLRMRKMENAAGSLYMQQFIRGFCHLYDGQEAVVVGADAAMTNEDAVITSYRNHCHQLSRGSDMGSILAELTGRRTGCQKGKGGSMHMFVRRSNYFGGQGIVGAQCPVGAGLAFAQQYKNTGRVAVTSFGDGAANQGQLAEAINMAAIWNLPCVFLCENNRYGMGTSTDRASGSGKDFYQRGVFIPGLKIDGMDVLAVRQGMEHAVKHARENGPVYVEVDTYRYHGHSMSDPGTTYRDRGEIQEVRSKRDPIHLVKSRILDNEWASDVDLKQMEKETKSETDRAVEFAKTSPEPTPLSLWEDVYVDDVPIRGTTPFNGSRSS